MTSLCLLYDVSHPAQKKHMTVAEELQRKPHAESFQITVIYYVSKVQTIFLGRKGRICARLLSGFLFLFVFYQFRINYWYMPMTVNLVASCAIGGLLASLGLFLSSFEAIRSHPRIGFLLYSPTFPVIVLFAGKKFVIATFLVMSIFYPYFVFFRKRVE